MRCFTMNTFKKTIIFFGTIFLFVSIEVQAQEKFFRAIGTPHNPKVEVSWNRYHTNAGLLDIMQRMEKAYPDLVKFAVNRQVP